MNSLRLQCGSKTLFFRPAGACSSYGLLRVTGELISAVDAIPTAQLEGEYGLESLYLAGDGLTLSASVYGPGDFDGVLALPGGAELQVWLTRRP